MRPSPSFPAVLLSLYLLCLIPVCTQPLPLPYTAPFDLSGDAPKWVEYRPGFDHSFNWFQRFESIFHDYPVGGFPTANDSVYDWLVSPPLQFREPAFLSMRFNVFALIQTAPTDYFGIWFSSGSPDPADGGYVELVDLTGSSISGEWMDTSGIPIPFTVDSGYIALVYKCSRNWFTAEVDEVTVVPASSSVAVAGEESVSGKHLQVSPNPFRTTATLSLDTEPTVEYPVLEIFTLQGESVRKEIFSEREIVLQGEEWPRGVYYYLLSNGEGVIERGTIIAR